MPVPPPLSAPLPLPVPLPADFPGVSTRVSFPGGSVEGRSTVLAAVPIPGGGTEGAGSWAVVTAETPFHPLDHSWPDQPADTGTLDGVPVRDCVTGAVALAGGVADAAGTAAGPTDGSAALPTDGPTDGLPATDTPPLLLLGADIPVRRGEEGWAWLVVHVTDQPVAVGTEVELRVDADRRTALSAAHTGCHLLALALNEALAPRWRKDPGRTDALGRPDFDSLAMDSSRMDVHASTDVYRIGKSLRKKGFTSDDLAADLPALTAAVNERLAAWVAADAPVRVEAPGPELTARRRWACDLPEGQASIACGGTHLHHLGQLAELRTELRLSDDGTELTATTTPKPR
ncbi:metal-dependent hydrolase [Streptacidiphilus sp. N1-3]|uniref:Metal-dependent hydrolase n=1 Tax=Streptacidiphilus alkalitolerans TaxID=3342712 RepID=A0ABV6X757_9ACTN